MENLKDDRGYNQIWVDTKSTRVRASRRCDYMISKMHPSPEKSVLEIGCGTGANSHMVATRTGMQVLGTDLCEPFIAEAKAKFSLANLRYEILNFNQPTRFGGQLFDYIVGNGILHHLYFHLDEALGGALALVDVLETDVSDVLAVGDDGVAPPLGVSHQQFEIFVGGLGVVGHHRPIVRTGNDDGEANDVGVGHPTTDGQLVGHAQGPQGDCRFGGAHACHPREATPA